MSGATFTLAQLSDVHLGPLPAIGPRHWNVKRTLGYLNWHRSRRDAYNRDVLDRLVADLLAHEPDHVAVTGDLVNLGLPIEHATALAWLRSLGPPEQVTAIPGNHDIYTRRGLAGDPGVGRWSAYMSANAAGRAYMADAAPGGYPFVRRLGDIALVGLNSAVPTPPFVAAGELGEAQRARLGPLLDRLAADGLARIVLIHHPPLPGQASRSRGLRDAPELAALLAAHGAELVIHGHNHLSMLTFRDWRAGSIPVVGVPSASLGIVHPHEPLARYHLFRMTRTGRAWGIEMIARGLAEPGGPVVERERRWLIHAPPAL